jgi:repressor LexA
MTSRALRSRAKEVTVHLTRRQKEILDFLARHIERKGYAPTIEEIGEQFGLSSLATVHKHLTNLQQKGLIKRAWNRSRALELVPTEVIVRALQLPLLGRVAAGTPIEAVQSTETIFVPEDMVGRKDTYVLQVKGDSMIDEQIRDGDYVIVENRRSARDGEMVIALVERDNVTLKKLYWEAGGKVRLQPANARMKPIYVDQADLRVQGVVIGVLRKY